MVRLVTIGSPAFPVAPARQSIRLPQGYVWWLIIVVGVMDTIAFLAANFDFTIDLVSVMSVLISLFSAVTVLLAWIFLRERLQWSQWLDIAIIFLGVTLVKV